MSIKFRVGRKKPLWKPLSLLLPKQVSVPWNHQVSGSKQTRDNRLFHRLLHVEVMQSLATACLGVQKFSELQKLALKVHRWKMAWDLTGTNIPTMALGVCHTPIPGNQVWNLAECQSVLFMLIYSSLMSTAGQCQAQYIVLDAIFDPPLIFNVHNCAVRGYVCTSTTASTLGEHGVI